MEKKLEELTIIEIKSLLYDQHMLQIQTNRNIDILTTELKKKQIVIEKKDGEV